MIKHEVVCDRCGKTGSLKYSFNDLKYKLPDGYEALRENNPVHLCEKCVEHALGPLPKNRGTEEMTTRKEEFPPTVWLRTIYTDILGAGEYCSWPIEGREPYVPESLLQAAVEKARVEALEWADAYTDSRYAGIRAEINSIRARARPKHLLTKY